MNLLESRDGFIVGECHFDTVEELEAVCFEDPELEDAYDEMCCAIGSKLSVYTYMLVSEIEYGDGSFEIPSDTPEIYILEA